jgi:hypothetical protein
MTSRVRSPSASVSSAGAAGPRFQASPGPGGGPAPDRTRLSEFAPLASRAAPAVTRSHRKALVDISCRPTLLRRPNRCAELDECSQQITRAPPLGGEPVGEPDDVKPVGEPDDVKRGELELSPGRGDAEKRSRVGPPPGGSPRKLVTIDERVLDRSVQAGEGCPRRRRPVCEPRLSGARTRP